MAIVEYILGYLWVGFVVHCGLYKFNIIDNYREDSESGGAIAIIILWPIVFTVAIAILMAKLAKGVFANPFECIIKFLDDVHERLKGEDE